MADNRIPIRADYKSNVRQGTRQDARDVETFGQRTRREFRNFGSQVAESGRELTRFGGNSRRTADDVDKLSRGTSRLTSSIRTLGFLVASYATVGAFLSFTDEEEKVRRLSARLTQLGGSYQEALLYASRFSGVNRNQILDSLSGALSVTDDYQGVLESLPFIFDLSAKTGASFAEVGKAVGSALEGDAKALARYSVELRRVGDSTLTGVEAIQKLSEESEGFGEFVRGGSIKNFGSQVKDLTVNTIAFLSEASGISPLVRDLGDEMVAWNRTLELGIQLHREVTDEVGNTVDRYKELVEVSTGFLTAPVVIPGVNDQQTGALARQGIIEEGRRLAEEERERLRRESLRPRREQRQDEPPSAYDYFQANIQSETEGIRRLFDIRREARDSYLEETRSKQEAVADEFGSSIAGAFIAAQGGSKSFFDYVASRLKTDILPLLLRMAILASFGGVAVPTGAVEGGAQFLPGSPVSFPNNLGTSGAVRNSRSQRFRRIGL